MLISISHAVFAEEDEARLDPECNDGVDVSKARGPRAPGTLRLPKLRRPKPYQGHYESLGVKGFEHTRGRRFKCRRQRMPMLPVTRWVPRACRRSRAGCFLTIDGSSLGSNRRLVYCLCQSGLEEELQRSYGSTTTPRTAAGWRRCGRSWSARPTRARSITYEELGGLMGYEGEGVLGHKIGPIYYCKQNGLPKLNTLVVGSTTASRTGAPTAKTRMWRGNACSGTLGSRSTLPTRRTSRRCSSILVRPGHERQGSQGRRASMRTQALQGGPASGAAPSLPCSATRKPVTCRHLRAAQFGRCETEVPSRLHQWEGPCSSGKAAHGEKAGGASGAGQSPSRCTKDASMSEQIRQIRAGSTLGPVRAGATTLEQKAL